MGDIAVTLVDLAQRDLLRVEEADYGADSLLSPLHCVPARRAAERYEARLLDQLAGGGRWSGFRPWRQTWGKTSERSGARWSMRW